MHACILIASGSWRRAQKPAVAFDRSDSCLRAAVRYAARPRTQFSSGYHNTGTTTTIPANKKVGNFFFRGTRHGDRRPAGHRGLRCHWGVVRRRQTGRSSQERYATVSTRQSRARGLPRVEADCSADNGRGPLGRQQPRGSRRHPNADDCPVAADLYAHRQWFVAAPGGSSRPPRQLFGVELGRPLEPGH